MDSLHISEYKGIVKQYYCGKHWIELEERDDSNSILVCLIDANDVLIAIVTGQTIEVLHKDSSLVPRKQDAGGQSAKRFQENRDLALNHWFKDKAFELSRITREYSNLRIILGIYSCNESYFKCKLTKDILTKIVISDSVSYINENGIRELITKVSNEIKAYYQNQDKLIVDEFATMLGKSSPLVDYGINSISNKNSLIIYSDKITKDEENMIKQSKCEIKKVKGFHIVDSLRVCVINKY